MLIELYAVPAIHAGQPTESPVSNPTGELPDEEPTLSPDQLLGSFDSRDEVIAFVNQQLTGSGATINDTQSGAFSDYTHIEWLTVTTTQSDASASQTYYLVTDEGY